MRRGKRISSRRAVAAAATSVVAVVAVISPIASVVDASLAVASSSKIKVAIAPSLASSTTSSPPVVVIIVAAIVLTIVVLSLTTLQGVRLRRPTPLFAAAAITTI